VPTGFADGVWLDEAPVRFLGMRLTATMTVLRLTDGSLLLHSPVAMTPERRAAVEALGPVAHLYSPNTFHHPDRRLGRGVPSATLHAPRGLAKKRPDLRIDRVHLGAPEPALEGIVEEHRIDEIVAIVGQPVQSKPGGSMCFYETADFTASVTIMRIAPSQADQVEREMRDAAAPYSAEVEAIDVGDRGLAWGSPGYGQGYSVVGDRGWMADVSVNVGDKGSKKDAVVRILERMIG
jgi:hypothetical protein